MDIAVSSIKPFVSANNFCWLVRVDKAEGWWIEYLVDIAPLSPHLYHLFIERYGASFLKSACFVVNFYPLDALFSGTSLFKPEPRMRYSKHELREMLQKGIGKAIAAFMHRHTSCMLVASPARPGLGQMYDELLRAHAQRSHFRYITQYKEDGIYVIEK